MNAVSTIKPHLSSIQCPAEIRQLQAWVMWRFEHHEGEPKPRKVPFYVNGQRRYGKPGSPDDRRQLATFDAARTAAARRGMDGVGIALLPEWGVTALDFDHCVLPDGQLHPEVAEIAAQSYAEWSPSGQGVRVLFKGDLSNRKSHGEPYGFETFSTKGFVTFTGNRLDITELMGNENTLAEVTPEVVALYSKRFKPREITDVAADGQTRRGMDDTELRELLAKLPNDGLPYESDDGPSWLGVGMALHHETQGEGFHLWDEWSQTSSKYTHSDYGHYKWVRFGNNGGASLTINSLAKWAGVDLGAAVPEDFDIVEADPAAPAAADPVALDWGTLPEEPPEPRFVIPGWMPENTVTLFAAHGGTGKSFMSLYISLCLATGRHPFALGDEVPRVRVVLYSAEDDLTAMQWRLRRYMRLMGISPGELQGWLVVLDATASDNVLFTRDRSGLGKTTKRFAWLRDQCQAFGAAVLVFDNASDGFDGNEVERAAVRQFISALKRVAPTTLLLSHVDAASSMALPGEGKGYSGSTAWNNSVRSRWLMARYENDDIVLSLQKSNYARTGSEASIRWSDELKLFEVVSHRIGAAKANDHRVLLLGLLHKLTTEMGKDVSPAKTSQTSAFNLMKDMPGFPNGLKTGDVAREVQAWLAEGLVREEHYSRGNRHEGQRIVLTAAGQSAIFSAPAADETEF